jgi:hypothetical protein
MPLARNKYGFSSFLREGTDTTNSMAGLLLINMLFGVSITTP